LRMYCIIFLLFRCYTYYRCRKSNQTSSKS
jgi:hypothetical protein